MIIIDGRSLVMWWFCRNKTRNPAIREQNWKTSHDKIICEVHKRIFSRLLRAQNGSPQTMCITYQTKPITNKLSVHLYFFFNFIFSVSKSFNSSSALYSLCNVSYSHSLHIDIYTDTLIVYLKTCGFFYRDRSCQLLTWICIR